VDYRRPTLAVLALAATWLTGARADAQDRYFLEGMSRMNEAMGSILPSVLILGAAAGIALHLTLARGWADDVGRLSAAGTVRIAALTVLVQALHFTEELSTGFHARLPAVFERVPMPLGFFITFNVAWLLIWTLSVWGLSARRRAALFPLWFLGIAALLNGVGHPLLSAVEGEYFPGLVTAPFIGVMGVALLRHLRMATSDVDPLPD